MINCLDSGVFICGEQSRRDILDKVTDGLKPMDIERIGRYIIKGDV